MSTLFQMKELFSDQKSRLISRAMYGIYVRLQSQSRLLGILEVFECFRLSGGKKGK